MGIENQRVGWNRPIVVNELITPHGDRKHAAEHADTYDAAMNSLPLMGIENPSRAKPWPMLASSSLPLMGIENRKSRGIDSAIAHRLITPHGDRKLADAKWRPSPDTKALITPHGDRKPHLTIERDRLWDSVGSNVPSR